MAAVAHSQQDFPSRLLAYLRGLLDEAGIGYCTPPVSMAGGYETRMYRFQLSDAPDAWLGPMVLRVFPATEPAQRAIREAAVQNSLANHGYPAPRSLHSGTDARVSEGPFLIMRLMPGETLLQAEPERSPAILGRAHAQLHQLEPAPLTAALSARGIDTCAFRYRSRLGRLSTKRKDLPWLADTLQWLIDNKAQEPDRLSVCHGDFHPLNLLVQGGEISAVLDWSGFAIGDPAMDVAFTNIVLTIAAREVLPLDSVEALWTSYREAYGAVRELDPRNLDYYRVLRCVMALVEGAEGQDVWARPTAAARLTEVIQRKTGIAVVRPV